jgi:hypothetical protein
MRHHVSHTLFALQSAADCKHRNAPENRSVTQGNLRPNHQIYKTRFVL